MSSESSRRRFLLAVTTGCVAGVAGCLGDGDNSEGSSDDTDQQDTEDDSEGAGDGTDDQTTDGSDGTDDQTTDGGNGTDPGEDNGTDGGTSDVTGDVTTEIDELDIVEWELLPERLPDEWFSMQVVVENAGEQETDPFRYDYTLVPYDADGNDISTSQGTATTGDNEMLPPGEQKEYTVERLLTGDPDDVVEFELTLRCDDPPEGVYCG